MEKKLQKIYLTYYNLFIAQYLWQAHFQILSIIFLKQFIELNVNSETCGIKYKYCNCFLEYTNFKDDLIENKCFCCNKNYQHKFDEKLKEQFFTITYKFSNHGNNKFFYCCEKVLIVMNIWMIGKNSMKHHYLKKKIFTVT